MCVLPGTPLSIYPGIRVVQYYGRRAGYHSTIALVVTMYTTTHPSRTAKCGTRTADSGTLHMWQKYGAVETMAGGTDAKKDREGFV